MKLTTIATYLFALAAAIFIGRLELHTDDTGVEVGLILVITFVLGCLHPRHAWQWALIIGLAVPVADLAFPPPAHSLNGPGGLALVSLVVVAIGFAGSYLGVLARKGISSFTGNETA